MIAEEIILFSKEERRMGGTNGRRHSHLTAFVKVQMVPMQIVLDFFPVLNNLSVYILILIATFNSIKKLKPVFL